MRKYISVVLIAILCISILTGFTNIAQIKDINACITSVDTIKLSEDVKIVGLGEATHGNSEMQALKLDVFKALVKNNHCRIFAIEGDFGGSAKVNQYIQGGSGTAEEAAAEIGFSIYYTKEMAKLIQWMRDYNQTLPENQKLKFYGYDMQRYDNNKEFLFAYLDKVDKQLSKKYSALLADLNDKTVYSQEKSKVNAALEKTEELMKKMVASKTYFTNKTNEKEFIFALQCAQSIRENAILQKYEGNYSNIRDKFMKNKVDWIRSYEENQMIFITGHNGHIEKTSASPGFTCMGESLAKSYGKAYYAIGTDFLESTFNVVTSSGSDKVITIKHTNPLVAQFKNLEGNIYFMDFVKAQENTELKQILNRKIEMTNIGAQFDDWQKVSSAFYTLKMVPSQAYDGMIVLKTANPSSRID